MTAWAIKAEVIYLPVMERGENEGSIDFAMRVKKVIADSGGLRSLEWDGTLKYLPVGVDLKEEVRKKYADRMNVDRVWMRGVKS